MAERVVRRRSAEEWQRLIAQLPADQQGQAEFCRRRGIHRPTLQWWRSRLRRRGVSAPAQWTTASAPQRGPGFAEVQVVPGPTRPSRGGEFELRWPDGLVLVIPAGFDAAALGRLLGVLEQAGC
jgi:hypothetical protein